MVVAVSDSWADTPSKPSICGKQITVTNAGGPWGDTPGIGTSVTVTIGDTYTAAPQGDLGK